MSAASIHCHETTELYTNHQLERDDDRICSALDSRVWKCVIIRSGIRLKRFDVKTLLTMLTSTEMRPQKSPHIPQPSSHHITIIIIAPSPTPSIMALAKQYLLFYNISMTAGWLLVLIRLLRALLENTDVYTAVIRPLKLFQTGAILEILHSAIGLIRAPAATTALQVSSRLMLVWGVADAIPAVRSNLSFTTMVLAWSLTEIPRYFYFSIAASSSTVPHWLTWIRYTTFIPLYPLGASSEWFTLFAALPSIQASRIFSIEMPNRYNFSFDYYIFCVLILALYIPGLPYMYSHMIKQRTKYVTPRPNIIKSQ